MTFTIPNCQTCAQVGVLCQNCIRRLAVDKAAAWTPATPGMTGRFLKLPADDSVPVRVKVDGVELTERGPGWNWSTRHGGWLYIECANPNAPVKVKLASGVVVTFGDQP